MSRSLLSDGHSRLLSSLNGGLRQADPQLRWHQAYPDSGDQSRYRPIEKADRDASASALALLRSLRKKIMRGAALTVRRQEGNAECFRMS